MTLTASARQLLAGFRILLVLTVVTGLAYPLLVMGVGQLVSPGNANGSRVEVGGKVIGSELIAQPFSGDQWFEPRPSAAGEDGYDTLASAASNLGPNSTDLAKAITERRAAYAKANHVAPAAVPVDAITASGSGLDPEISPANARVQATRVAMARGLPVAQVRQVVDEHTKGRTLGVLGEARVNVLDLNLALQRLNR